MQLLKPIVLELVQNRFFHFISFHHLNISQSVSIKSWTRVSCFLDVQKPYMLTNIHMHTQFFFSIFFFSHSNENNFKRFFLFLFLYVFFYMSSSSSSSMDGLTGLEDIIGSPLTGELSSSIALLLTDEKPCWLWSRRRSCSGLTVEGVMSSVKMARELESSGRPVEMPCVLHNISKC